MIQKPLLQYVDAKWISIDVNLNGETIAFERERSEESQGMPMLTVIKNLDEDTMDLLVSAWCVRLWGEIGKMARGKRRSSLIF